MGLPVPTGILLLLLAKGVTRCLGQDNKRSPQGGNVKEKLVRLLELVKQVNKKSVDDVAHGKGGEPEANSAWNSPKSRYSEDQKSVKQEKSRRLFRETTQMRKKMDDDVVYEKRNEREVKFTSASPGLQYSPLQLMFFGVVVFVFFWLIKSVMEAQKDVIRLEERSFFQEVLRQMDKKNSAEKYEHQVQLKNERDDRHRLEMMEMRRYVENLVLRLQHRGEIGMMYLQKQQVQNMAAVACNMYKNKQLEYPQQLVMQPITYPSSSSAPSAPSYGRLALEGAAVGASIGTTFGPAGTVIGAGIGGVAGFIASFF